MTKSLKCDFHMFYLQPWQVCTVILNKNTLDVKKCEANQKQHCKQVRPKTLISVEAKKLLIKNLFNYLNDRHTIVYSIFSQI